MKKRLSFLTLLFCVFPMLVCAQNSRQINQYYMAFDQVLGVQSTALYNGAAYKETLRIDRDNQKFLGSPEFTPGTVSYQGQTFYGVDMKYNVFDDELIVRLKNNRGESIVQLIKEHVSGFEIYGESFVRLGHTGDETDFRPGYYQVLAKIGGHTLYRKYRKNRSKIINGNSVIFAFKDQGDRFLLQKNDDSFISISSRRDFNNAFPNLKKELQSYYQDNPGYKDLNQATLYPLLLKRVAELSND